MSVKQERILRWVWKECGMSVKWKGDEYEIGVEWVWMGVGWVWDG